MCSKDEFEKDISELLAIETAVIISTRYQLIPSKNVMTIQSMIH